MYLLSFAQFQALMTCCIKNLSNLLSQKPIKTDLLKHFATCFELFKIGRKTSSDLSQSVKLTNLQIKDSKTQTQEC